MDLGHGVPNLSHSIHFSHHQPHVANERWKPSWSELRNAVSVKYTLNFKDLVQKNPQNIFLVVFCIEYCIEPVLKW